MKKFFVLFIAISLCSMTAFGQAGIFDKQADWVGTSDDEQKVEGAVSFDNGVYILEGNGDDIWGSEDEGFFLYSEKSGSWTLTAKAVWDIPSTDEWGKMGLMIRDEGDSITSANYFLRERTGTNDSPADNISAQWRMQDGVESDSSSAFEDENGDDIGDPNFEGVWMRISRNAISNVCFASWSMDGQNWTQAHNLEIDLGETAAYGLVITNHQDNQDIASAMFSDVSLEEGAPLSAKRYLPEQRVTGGQTIDVKIEIGNPGAAKDIEVVETIPEGWSITDISHGGTVDGNAITWQLNAPEGMTDLTYKATSVPDAELQWSGTADGAPIAGRRDVVFLRARTPVATGWNPPEGGWLYIFDPDLGSQPDMDKDGWKHNNGSDSYVYQPVIPAGPNAGQVWENPGLIDDGEGGQCLLMYDPGDPRNMEVYGEMDDPCNRKMTLNYDMGEVTKAVAAFRVRSQAFTDDFGVDIPFGYPDDDFYNLLGLMKNEEMRDLDLDHVSDLTASGLFFSPDFPESLNFPTYSESPNQPVLGSWEDPWDNTEWHEYWITWNITEGEKSTALYVDGELEAKFSYPRPGADDVEMNGGFFNRVREADNDVPVGNTVFRITFRQTGQSGNLQFDYICFAPGTDEPPTAYTPVNSWFLY
ncbi:hypothetical protein GF373_11880 [bacterium]|nr:hypothetical protein [bacterium]